MNELFLSDKMIHEIFEAVSKGESYSYSDGKSSIEVSPYGIHVQYNNQDTRKQEVKQFLAFVDRLDDELFADICESFEGDELMNLQTALDTDNYKHSIETFVTRAREIAGSKLAEVINDADAEIRHQEEVIRNAHAIINDIHTTLDQAHAKYTF